jgi:CheY-like chemotaxis protein
MSTNEVEMMKSIRLLLVEDNPADARVVERHLKDAGLAQVNCEVVQTAAAATERLQKVEYDLVLLDLGLPDATGLEALRALRAVADLTPIIVLTGSDDYKQGLTAVREGAQDYLEKRRVNAGMLSRVVSYSVERNMFHRDLVRATRRYQDLFNNVPVALFTANHDGALKTANAACMKMLACQGIPLAKVNFLDLLFEPGKRSHFLDMMSRSAWSRAGKPPSRLQGRQAARAGEHRAAVRRHAGVRRLGRQPHRHLHAQADAGGARPTRGQPAPGAEARGHRPAGRRHRARDQHADAVRR